LGGSKLGDYAVTVNHGTLAVIQPASLMGFVFADFNDDGQIDFGEKAISGASIRLQGTDDLGRAVDMTSHTDGNGSYLFSPLRPGSYTITETRPAGYQEGVNSVGTVNG